MDSGGTVQPLTPVSDWASLGFLLGEESVTHRSLGQNGLLWAPPLRWQVACWEARLSPTHLVSSRVRSFPHPHVPPASSFDLKNLWELSVCTRYPGRTGPAWTDLVSSAVRVLGRQCWGPASAGPGRDWP